MSIVHVLLPTMLQVMFLSIYATCEIFGFLLGMLPLYPVGPPDIVLYLDKCIENDK